MNDLNVWKLTRVSLKDIELILYIHLRVVKQSFVQNKQSQKYVIAEVLYLFLRIVRDKMKTLRLKT